jgi:hypothetical protein
MPAVRNRETGKADTMKQKKKSFDGANRRQWRRVAPDDIPSLKGVSINQETDVRVIDISKGGMLLHTAFRLRPNMKILLKIVTTKGTFRIPGLVLRSSIRSISDSPLYESAITFESPLAVLDDLIDENASAHDPGSTPTPDLFEDYGDIKPLSHMEDGDNAQEDPAVLTVLASAGFEADLDKMLQANNW